MIVDDIVGRIESLVEDAADFTDDGLKYARISYWILFAFGVALSVLIFIILLILCGKCNGKCQSSTTCPRFLLVIVAFFSVLFAVLCFMMLTGSAAFSGVCGYVRELNQDQVSELYRFGDLDP